MKVLITVSIALLALMSAGIFFQQTSTHKQVPQSIVQAYSRWLQTHGKLYASPSEQSYRLQVFYEQSLYIERINAEYSAASNSAGLPRPSEPMFAMNRFGDLTGEEFRAKHTGSQAAEEDKQPAAGSEPEPSQDAAHPVASQGEAFSIAIRQQGACGTCWAFAAVAALEKYYFDKQGLRVEFSQQELLDCKEGVSCTLGGIPEFAFKYAQSAGLSTAGAYPYVASKGACRRNLPERVKIPNIQIASEPFAQKRAVYLAAKGVHSTVLVYGSGKLRFLGKSDAVFDAKAAGECAMRFDHAVNVASASGNQLTVYSSWGLEWANNGFKTISVCAENNVYGTGSRIAHPYGNI